MAKKTKPSSSQRLPSVAVIVSRYNDSITAQLREGALAAYVKRGGVAANVAVFEAPGAFELPSLAMVAAETTRYHGIVTLGCVIKGETRHDRYIAQAIAEGIVNVSLITGVPVAFGVLTTDNAKQARDRAGGRKGNKGAEAMDALLDTIATRNAIIAGTKRATTGRVAADKASPASRKAGGKA